MHNYRACIFFKSSATRTMNTCTTLYDTAQSPSDQIYAATAMVGSLGRTNRACKNRMQSNFVSRIHYTAALLHLAPSSPLT